MNENVNWKDLGADKTPEGKAKLRAKLREVILAQVEEERRMTWQKELEQDAKFKNPRLNHELETPHRFALWKNMAPEKPAPAPEVPDMLRYEDHNEQGDGELLQTRQAGQFVFDHTIQKWMHFNGVIWEEDSIAQAEKLPMDELAKLYDAAADKLAEQLADEQIKAEAKLAQLEAEQDAARQNREDEKLVSLGWELDKAKKELARLTGTLGAKKKRLQERARKLRGRTRAMNVLKVASTGKGSLGISGKEWEQHPLLMACADGLVDLETGRLFRSTPGHYLRKASPMPYVGLGTYSNWWESHLRKIFCGDEELVTYFEHIVGYSVTGERYNKDIWVAYGPQADNGKSFTFNTIKSVVGDYATTIKVDVLLDDGRDGKGPDPDMMVLDGLRMGLASEAGEKARFSIEKIKAITGGDDVRARGMYMDSKIIQSKVKLWLHTNTIPKLTGYDPGFQLRLKVIPFMAKFTRQEEADPKRFIYPAMDQQEARIIQQREGPAIFAWVLRCAWKFLRNTHYSTPSSVSQFTKEYFDEQDLLKQFLDACCNEAPDEETQAKYLYAAFKKYCMEELGTPESRLMSLTRFGTELQKRYRRISRNRIYYSGLTLKSEWKNIS